jgi:hypothetical protein
MLLSLALALDELLDHLSLFQKGSIEKGVIVIRFAHS